MPSFDQIMESFNRVNFVLRFTIGMLSLALIVLVGLVVIKLAFRSWRRMDNYLRQTPEHHRTQGSAWEAAATRVEAADQPDPGQDDADDEPDDGAENGGGPKPA